MNPYHISVVGTGYVGLSTALGFAIKGYSVLAVDSDKMKIENIIKGKLPFYEPDFQESLESAVKDKKLSFATTCRNAILNTDLTFVTVGTPNTPAGNIDLQYIEKSTGEIGKALKKKDTYHLVIIKSTVLPTTTETLVKTQLEKHSGKRCGLDIGLCMNPEFLREGSALIDVLHPDRIVIGEYDKKSGDRLETFYKGFYSENLPPIIRTNLSTAELIKYASNAFLASKISFINTIASICEKTPNADVTIVAKGMGFDKRIGSQFLNAGLGYGGSCFPKDVKALIAYSKTSGYSPKLLKSIENVNRDQPLKAIRMCKKFLKTLKNKNIAVLGLAFKPDTDDMREAVSVPIIYSLLEEGARVKAYDPVAISNASSLFKDKIEYASSAIQCITNADCCIVVTEWDEFRKLTPADFAKNMKKPILIDGRRIYNPEIFNKETKYAAIGLGKIKNRYVQ